MQFRILFRYVWKNEEVPEFIKQKYSQKELEKTIGKLEEFKTNKVLVLIITLSWYSQHAAI